MQPRNNKKKKIVLLSLSLLSLPLIVLAYFTLFPQFETTVIAGPMIYASNATANAGSEVYVSVSINENPGFAGIVLELHYDEKILRPLDVLQGTLIADDGLFVSNVQDGVIKATWFNVAEMDKDGELFLVKFLAVASAKTGDKSPITLSYDIGNIANLSYENVEFTLSDATVTIR